MGILLFVLLMMVHSNGMSYKEQYCMTLNNCVKEENKTVCGMKKEDKGVKLRIFDNHCLLMKYGCSVSHGDEYGLADLTLCQRAFPNYFKEQPVKENLKPIENDDIEKTDSTDNFMQSLTNKDIIADSCDEYCTDLSDDKQACGISKHGDGFKVRLFLTRCEMLVYNCIKNATFVQTEIHICDGLDVAINNFGKHVDTNHEELNDNINLNPKNQVTNENINSFLKESNDGNIKPSDITRRKATDKKYKHIVIVDHSMLDFNGDINDTVNNFFESTHLNEFPLIDVSNATTIGINDTRRMHLNLIKPNKVFQPWIILPKNLKNMTVDRWHEPTLSSCYHKCPRKCPDTYAPVCGMPGNIAREPSLVFMNHCFMDVAQCKMRWEDKSETASSSAYIESSFVFCLGDVLSNYLRFLPVLRTLQHMGRLAKKGVYKYKIRNFGFYNNYLDRQPNPMG